MDPWEGPFPVSSPPSPLSLSPSPHAGWEGALWVGEGTFREELRPKFGYQLTSSWAVWPEQIDDHTSLALLPHMDYEYHGSPFSGF